MKNRWTQQGAEDALRRWESTLGRDFALRLYTARLLGQEPDLVLHGGGNVSLKGTVRTVVGDEVDAIFVKCSGYDLAALEPAGMVAVQLAYLWRLLSLESLDDSEMVGAIRTRLFDASAPMPSIETLVHAALPHKYVDHSHADAVLALTNRRDGERVIRDTLDERAAVLPYVRPGFELAKAVARAHAEHPNAQGMVLLHHGLFTFADDARESYERHIEIVDRCERLLKKRAATLRLTPRTSSVGESPAGPAALAARAAPILRGLVARPTGDEDQPYARRILEWRATERILDVINSAEAAALAASGPLTGDHLIHTKPYPLFVEPPAWSDTDALRRQLSEAVEKFKHSYRAYVTEHDGNADEVDPAPAVVWLPGAGLFCWGGTKRHARVVADLAEHTLLTKAHALALGAYESLPASSLYDMEFRAIQRQKLSGSTPDRAPGAQGGMAKPASSGRRHADSEYDIRRAYGPRPLASQVVVVSGGAGAIGSAVALECVRAGAHVAVTDLDEQRLARVVERIESNYGSGRAIGQVMDVTDEGSVKNGYDNIVRHFGGVDVIVPNAGIAHAAPIEALAREDFVRVMEVNAVGYLLFMQQGIRVLKAQGLGGNIVINASKNVFGPGKEFGAYSASKAAGHQLGKVAAIELAPHNIRVNMINADAVFGDDEIPSGLWREVGPERAKTRGMKYDDLPEYYRQRNLLKARVHGHHVGRAVVFFASNATPTTGATLPVDGGVIEAFPR